MKSIVVKQVCHGCGKEFFAQYYENGSYEIDDENACLCECEFSPVDGPSIGEWLKEIEEV